MFPFSEHEVEAYDQMERMGWDEDYPECHPGYYCMNSFEKNPLYYHKRFQFNKIVAETEKSYLFNFPRGDSTLDVWVPKSVCAKLKKKTVYIHRLTFLKCEKTAIERSLNMVERLKSQSANP